MFRSSLQLNRSVLLICLLWPLLFVFTHLLIQSYQMDNDFGRDLVDMQAITHGDIRLLGPKLSFGGIHSGPYYYYVFAPLLLLTPGVPETLIYANAVFSWLALVVTGILLLRMWRCSLPSSVLMTYVLGLSAYFVFSSRGPGNAFTYIPWLVPLILIWPTLWRQHRVWWWLVLGVGWGVVLNFHLIAGVILLSLLVSSTLFEIFQRKNTKSRFWFNFIWQLVVIGLGVGLTFVPFIAFEATHNFVQLKNTFVDKSYQVFLANENLSVAPTTSTNPLVNGWLLAGYAQAWLPYIGLLLIGLGLSLSQKCLRHSPVGVLVTASLIASLILVCIARSQIAIHYFFPVYVLIQISFLLTITKVIARRRWQLLALSGYLMLSIFTFPRYMYLPSTRPIERSRAAAQAVADSPLRTQLKKTPFAVYVTRETPLAPQGYEYRYFLAEHGLFSLPPDAYAQASQLLWFAEDPSRDLTQVTSWELDQFGPRQELYTVAQEPVLSILFTKAASESAAENQKNSL